MNGGELADIPYWKWKGIKGRRKWFRNQPRKTDPSGLDAWREDMVPESDAIHPEEIPVSASTSGWMRNDREHNMIAQPNRPLNPRQRRSSAS